MKKETKQVQLHSMLNIGDKAPPFTAKDQNGDTHTLKDYEGRWVLIYFYPKDNTSGCTKEACGIRDAWKEYKDHGIVVLGVSKDSVESHKKFETDHELPFTLLSDPERKIIKSYGAEKGSASTKRISYLISPRGTIADVYRTVDPKTHATEVLEQFLHVSELEEN